MATVSDLIKKSLRMIGVIAANETPSSSESADALSALNDLIESLSLHNLFIYKQVTESFSLIGSQQVYQMGSGLDFDTSRPVEIVGVNAKKSSIEYPLRILTEKKWRELSLKTTTSTLPTAVYPEYSEGSVNLKFWPIPTEANSVEIYSKKTVSSFSAISDEFTLPQGYMRALKTNLALELCDEYGIEPSQALVSKARSSLAAIKRQNSNDDHLLSDAPMSRGNWYNFRTGETE